MPSPIQIFLYGLDYLFFAGLSEIGLTTCLAKANDNTGSAYLLWIAGFVFR
jgi:hypothetical protein